MVTKATVRGPRGPKTRWQKLVFYQTVDYKGPKVRPTQWRQRCLQKSWWGGGSQGGEIERQQWWRATVTPIWESEIKMPKWDPCWEIKDFHIIWNIISEVCKSWIENQRTEFKCDQKMEELGPSRMSLRRTASLSPPIVLEHTRLWPGWSKELKRGEG